MATLQALANMNLGASSSSGGAFGSQYDNETYLRSLAKSRADADRALTNALTEINRQRRVGIEQAGKIPGATTNAFNTAQGTLNTDLASLGVDPMQSVNQAFTLGKQGYSKASGHLQTGFTEQRTQRASAAKNIVAAVKSDITGKANEYISRRQQEDRERKAREQAAAQQRALQQELMNRQFALQQEMLAAQAAEAQRQRDFMAAQAYLDRLAALPPPPAPSLPAPTSSHVRPLSAPTTAVPRKSGAQL